MEPREEQRIEPFKGRIEPSPKIRLEPRPTGRIESRDWTYGIPFHTYRIRLKDVWNRAKSAMEPPKGRMEPLKGRMEPPRFAYRTSTQSREILNYKTTSINTYDAIVEQGCILYSRYTGRAQHFNQQTCIVELSARDLVIHAP